LAKGTQSVTFVGRLGTYRYLDMDVTIKESLDAAQAIQDGLADGSSIPAFAVDPLS
jgi:UDP-galactopyranose mutase